MTSKRISKMTELALTFPTLRDAPGVKPFDTGLLDAWAAAGGRGSGSQHATRFLLAVWNSEGEWTSGTFDAVKAMSSWDTNHRAAFVAWCNNPWWP